MTIYSKITIGGSEVEDNYDYNVNKSIGENNQSSNFDINIENFAGRNKNNYVIGDEVIIYADLNITPPITKIFAGILEDKKFRGRENDEKMDLSGRDYSARLMDRTVEPEVYTNLPAGSIVKDIIDKYTNNITTTNVQDSPMIIDRITFNQTPLFDAVKKMADLSNYTFYVDENKDLHFEPKAGSSSGYTFDNTNLKEVEFKDQRDGIYNQVWVYGDRYLDGFKETFTGVAGSIYTLLYNPHNTSVQMSGTIPIVIQPGGIYNITYGVGSMIRYLVNFDDKQIILTSGTSQGNNLYIGSKIDVIYNRSLPIVKVGDNEVSKAKYGTRIKVIQDKDIKDPATAEQILTRELEKSGEPVKEGKLSIKGLANIIPGQTCIVNVPNHGVNNQTYDILEANYNFSKENNLNDDILSIKVNKKIPDITDTMKDIYLQLKKLQSADISTSDFITRYQYTAGSEGIRQSGLKVWTQNIGSSFILNHPVNSLLGSYTSHSLGSWYPGSILNWSGGYF